MTASRMWVRQRLHVEYDTPQVEANGIPVGTRKNTAAGSTPKQVRAGAKASLQIRESSETDWENLDKVREEQAPLLELLS